MHVCPFPGLGAWLLSLTPCTPLRPACLVSSLWGSRAWLRPLPGPTCPWTVPLSLCLRPVPPSLPLDCADGDRLAAGGARSYCPHLPPGPRRAWGLAQPLFQCDGSRVSDGGSRARALSTPSSLCSSWVCCLSVHRQTCVHPARPMPSPTPSPECPGQA